MGCIATFRSVLVVVVAAMAMAGFMVGTNPQWVEAQPQPAASRHPVHEEGTVRSAVKELTRNEDPEVQKAINACERGWVALKVNVPGAGELLAAL